MRFLADHCTYGVTVRFLRSLGHDVETSKEAGLMTADDTVVLQHAGGSKAVLITNDQDFCNVLLYPPASHLGIVVLKITKATCTQVHAVLKQMLDQVPPEEFRGTLFVVDRNKYRIRRSASTSSSPA